jgi:hypothetical protein
MPAKPIKYGIKVFCVCCAVSGIMLAYEVYCGNKDKKTDGTSVQVCDRLAKVKEAELTKSRGRTLYTDNYYTSIKLAKHLFEKYRWTLVGTIVPTDKKTREDHDIPFLKVGGPVDLPPPFFYSGGKLKIRRAKKREEKQAVHGLTGGSTFDHDLFLPPLPPPP